jgi:hypothetical protein
MEATCMFLLAIGRRAAYLRKRTIALTKTHSFGSFVGISQKPAKP